jgi:hypothetical protein
MSKDFRAELVRVDAQGQAHPIGVVASQRLRARAGTYRLLPSPRHIVFMRYTGEDGRRDAEDGAVVRLAGEITAPAGMCEVFAMVAQAGWRGELVVQDAKHSRSVFFEGGSVVGVQTSVEDERLGEVLYRFGAITHEQHALVKEQVRGGKRYGSAAIELGILTQEQVYAYITRQVEEVVFAMLTIADGTFFFLDGFDATQLASRHAVSANALLMDGVTRLDEIRYFHQKIPSSEYIPVRLEQRAPPAEEYAAVYAAIDGKLDVDAIGRATGKGEFETTKAVYALIQSHHVAIHPPRLTGGPEAVVLTANLALRAIYAAARREDKLAPVKESMASFAVGAGVYDMLFRGAGPDDDGALLPQRVAENAVMVTSGSDPEHELAGMLHEYVSFALFCAGGLIQADAEQALRREIAPILQKLRS